VTRKSEREIASAVDDLQAAVGVDGDPIEIEITDTVVATDATHDAEDITDVDAGDVAERRRTRIWRDETGEWHSERLDQEADDATK